MSSALAEEQQLLDVGRPMVGIDPGSRSMGVAVADGAGRLAKSWTLKPPVGELMRRQAWMSGALRKLMRMIVLEFGDGVTVVIEDGIYNAVPAVVGILGEMRGLAMAEAWRAGFKVRKVSPLSWRTKLKGAEKTMKRESAAGYVAYWKARMNSDFRSADEVDAAHIATWAARK